MVLSMRYFLLYLPKMRLGYFPTQHIFYDMTFFCRDRLLYQSLSQKFILYYQKALKEDKNIYFSGDWSAEPSIDGAIKSGRICAEKLNNE